MVPRLLTIGLLILLVAGNVQPAAADDKVISVAATEWQPYMSEQFTDNGVIPEITRVALQQAGYKAVFIFYPWKRLLAITQSGTVDAAIGVSHTAERTAYFLYPQQTIFEDRKVIFYRKGMDVIETFGGNLAELCPDKVGVVDGSYLEDRLRAVDCLSVDPGVTVEVNLKKLLVGRFKYLLDSETSINLLISSEAIAADERNNIALYETPVDIDKNYMVFSKQAALDKPHLQGVLKRFDEILAQMKADGTYARILRDHHMTFD